MEQRFSEDRAFCVTSIFPPTKTAFSLKIAATAIGIVAAISGCSSLNPHSSFRAISSTPPSSVIELTAPAVVTDMGTTTTFPVGKYRPTYEDEGGYYYEAPSKVLVDDVGVYGFDGGLYVARGKTEPANWYIIRPNGRRSSGHFKTTPLYRLTP